MRVREVAARLEISSSLVYQLIATGKLRCYRIGNGRGVVRVTEEQLQEYLKAAEPAPAQPPKNRVRLRHLRLS